MAGNEQGNILGVKPVVGSKPDNMQQETVIALLKRLINQLGLGAYDFGFDSAFEVYQDKAAQKLYELERYFHNRERWFGLAVTPVGETHRADEMNGVVAPFVLTTGNSAFGAWVQILGSGDTPFESGMTSFDGHRFLMSSTNSAGVYAIQLIAGEYVDIPRRLANKEYTTAPYTASTTANDAGIYDFMSRRIPAGAKVWARAAGVGLNGKTLSFYFGFHEYIY